MKKIFSLIAVVALSMGFTACESIPSPYEIFDEIIGGEEKDIYYESAACYSGWNLEIAKDATITDNPWSQGNSYTQATGYQKWDGADAKSNREAEGFLVSPKFKTTAKDGKVNFSFDYCIGYANNDKDYAKHVKIYVSKTYTEGAIDLAEWEEYKWTATHTSTDWTLANTGALALPEAYVNQENVHVAFWFYAPKGGSSTFEIKNFVIETGEGSVQPDQPGSGDETPSGEAAGDGTKDNPYNVAATIAFVNKLEKNAKSEPVYIKGIVKKFKSGEEPGNQYGNATFYIVDSQDAAEDFYCYRVMGPGNKNFTSADQLKVGDEVVVYGPLTLYSSSYGDTPETVQKECYVYSVNGKVEEGAGTDTPDQPTPGVGAKGAGTAADPYNVAGVIAYTKGLAADVNSDHEVYFTGVVKNFKAGEEPGNQYGNATFYVVDEGGSDEFCCYRVLGKDGKKFTEGAEAPAVGDKVTIRGLVVNYKGNTPETASGKAYVEAVVKGEGGGEVNPGGNNGGNTGGDPVVVGNTVKYDLTNLGLENATSVDGQTFAIGGANFKFDKGTGSTSPAYYTSGGFNSVRVYACNNITITAPSTIKNVVFNTTSPASGTKYNGNTTSTTTAGTLSWPGDQKLLISDVNAASLVFCNFNAEGKGGVQLRVQSIEIEYVDAASARRAARRAVRK